MEEYSHFAFSYCNHRRQPDLKVIKIGSFGSVSPPRSIWKEAGCGSQCSCRVSTKPPLPGISFSHHFTYRRRHQVLTLVASEKFRSPQLLTPARGASLVLSRPSPPAPFCSRTDQRPRASRQSTCMHPVLFAWTCVVNLLSCIKLRPNAASLGKSFTDPSKLLWLAAWGSVMKTPRVSPSDSGCALRIPVIVCPAGPCACPASRPVSALATTPGD